MIQIIDDDNKNQYNSLNSHVIKLHFANRDYSSFCKYYVKVDLYTWPQRKSLKIIQVIFLDCK